MKIALGIDIGGTNVKALIIREDGEVLERHTCETRDDGTDGWTGEVRAVYKKLLHEGVTHVGLAAPGLANREGTAICYQPGKLPGLENRHWAEFLGSPRPIPMLNDAHAALMGEFWMGAARGMDNVVMLTLGTGVGGAAMVDGRLLRGHLGRAGHFGHMSLDPDGPPSIFGTPGAIEMQVANCSVGLRTGGRFQSTGKLVQAMRTGDAAAREAWDRSLRYLGAHLAGLINGLDPEAILIGGGIARAGDDLFQPLRTHLDAWEWRPAGARCRIEPAQLGEWAGAYGAAHQAIFAQPAAKQNV